MNLYLMRHGPALNVGEGGASRDFDRVLSPEGMDAVARVAMQLVGLNVKPETILSSPLARAKQTAEMVAEALGAQEKLQVDNAFACGLDYASGIASVNRCGAGDVMIVGHAPDMGGFAAHLISACGDASIYMRTAGVCCIAFERKIGRGAGVLSWLLPPVG